MESAPLIMDNLFSSSN